MPLRIPRIAKVAVVIGLASAPIALVCVPAYAGQVRSQEWWLSAMHVTSAWRTSKGSGVKVAVLADGVAAMQADLTENVESGPDLTDSGRTPGGPHFGAVGTGLASLIAGHGHGKDNASGIIGIAPGATIISVRVTLSPGDPLWSNHAITARLPAAIAAGIRYAVKQGATVIDLPADPGLPVTGGQHGSAAAAGGSAAEQAAIAYAVRRGVVLVAPAGDNAKATDAVNYPAAYRGVIAVGAFGPGFVRPPFSNRQPYVTLTAAGDGVVAAAPVGYQTMNSTWAASAVVAGIAALVRSQFPNLNPAQVAHAVTTGTAIRPAHGSRNGSGSGTADAGRALAAAALVSPPRALPAESGALPHSRPMPPAVPSSASSVARSLLADGAISAGVLVVLLVPIIAYGSITSRRNRRTAMVAAERARRSRMRTDDTALPADPLLDFFGPQHARPAGQRSTVGPMFQPGQSQSGRTTFPPWQTMTGDAAIPGDGITPGNGIAPIGSAVPDSGLVPGGAAQPGGLAAGGTGPGGQTLPGRAVPGRTLPGGVLPGRVLPGRPSLSGRSAFAGRSAPAMPAGRQVPSMLPAPPAAAPAVFPPSPQVPAAVPSAHAADLTASRPLRSGRRPPAHAGLRAGTDPRGRPSLGRAPGQGTDPGTSPAANTGPRPAVGSGPDVGLVPDARPTVRQVPVSGSPPWAPAPQPTSELPWGLPAAPANGPTPDRPSGAPAQSPVPREAVWHAAPAEAAAGSLFAPISRHPAEQPAPQPAATGNGGTSGSGTGGRPIYVWNPTASTDTFPAVNADYE